MPPVEGVECVPILPLISHKKYILRFRFETRFPLFVIKQNKLLQKSKLIIVKNDTNDPSQLPKASICRETKSLKIRMIHIEIQKSKLKTPIFQFGLIFEEWKEKGRKTKKQTKISVLHTRASVYIQEYRLTC